MQIEDNGFKRDFEEDKRKAFESGMNGHLAKPLNIHELFKAIAKFCKTE